MTDAPMFLDANVFMYAAGAEHPYKGTCIGILELLGKALVRKRGGSPEGPRP